MRVLRHVLWVYLLLGRTLGRGVRGVGVSLQGVRIVGVVVLIDNFLVIWLWLGILNHAPQVRRHLWFFRWSLATTSTRS